MGTYLIPKNATAYPSLPVGKLNDLDRRVAALEAGGGGGSFTLETPTGTVNSSNTSFTASSTPTAVIADNMFYINGFGCTISGTSITMTSPPVFFIRAII